MKGALDDLAEPFGCRSLTHNVRRRRGHGITCDQHRLGPPAKDALFGRTANAGCGNTAVTEDEFLLDRVT